ncbi:hypothetical protein BS78_09G150400 [Paspalum vaginatum]|nr:hypothetical protein BS78_09G150400 [Paspalum vaginatum]
MRYARCLRSITGYYLPCTRGAALPDAAPCIRATRSTAALADVGRAVCPVCVREGERERELCSVARGRDANRAGGSRGREGLRTRAKASCSSLPRLFVYREVSSSSVRGPRRTGESYQYDRRCLIRLQGSIGMRIRFWLYTLSARLQV